MKRKFAKYLRESCRQSSDEQFSFKYFLNIAFVREISPKLTVYSLPSGSFARMFPTSSEARDSAGKTWSSRSFKIPVTISDGDSSTVTAKQTNK